MAEKRFIPFLQAVREGIIKEGEQVDISACLPKAGGVVTLTPEETGWHEKQTFDRNKENVTWEFAMDKNNIPTLHGKNVQFCLKLVGKVGFENGVANLNKICLTWSNTSLGIQALSNMKAYVSSPRLGYYHFGLYGVNGSSVSYWCLYDSYFRSNNCIITFQPIVSILTSDILIDLESKDKDGIWKLVPPEKV